MAQLNEDASGVHKFSYQGEFFIHKKRASACFTYVLPAVPSPDFPNLKLSLDYNSATSGDAFLQEGWRLAGFEGVRKTVNGDYYLQDQKIFPVVISHKEIALYDPAGIKRSFEKLENSMDDYFHLLSSQDMYGNICSLQYDQQGRLNNIRFVQGDICQRVIMCSYCPQSGKLVRVSSLLEDAICFDTEIIYENGHLVQVKSYACEDNIQEPQSPAEFRYDDKTGLLSWLKFRLDARIEVFYADNSGGVSSYHELVKVFRGKDKKHAFQITSTGLTSAFDQPPFYELVTIWSPSSRIGTTWRYSLDPDTYGFVIAEEFGSKRDKRGHIVPKRSSHYQYCQPRPDCLPKISQITTIEKIQGRKPSQTFELFEYDAVGNLTCASDGKTLTKKEYIRGPAPFQVTFLKSVTLYDVTKSAALSAEKILKADRFSHKFDPATGALCESSHEQAMTADSFTNPVISDFDKRGRLRVLINESGVKHSYQYDRFGFLAEEELSSSDRQNRLVNRFRYCPRSGEILKYKQWNGAIKSYDRDYFGNVRAEYQEGTNTSENCVLNRQVQWCEQFSVYVEATQLPAGNESGVCNILTIFDGNFRPLANAVEIEPEKWEVVFQAYEAGKKMAAQTLPFIINAPAEELIGKIRARKKKILWKRTYFDDLGRISLVKQPDGSKTIYLYCKRKDGTTIEEVVSVDRSGRKEKGDRREITANGEVRFYKPADKEKTVQKLNILGQVIQETSGESEHIDFEYDLLGNCIAENHSKFGQTRQIIGPDLQVHIQQKKDHITYFERDWLGRITRVRSENDNNAVTEYRAKYEFDPVSNTSFETFKSPRGVKIKTGFSSLGDEVSKQIQIGKKQFGEIKTERWPNGQVRKRLFPDGRAIEYAYDPRGYLKDASLVGDDSPIVKYENINSVGLAERAVFQNGVHERKQFDAFGQQTAFNVQKNSPNSSSKNLLSQKFGYLDGYPGRISAISRIDHTSITETNRYDYGPQFALVAEWPRMSTSQKEIVADGWVQETKIDERYTDLGFDPFGLLRSAVIGKDKQERKAEFEYDAGGELLQSVHYEGTTTTFLASDYEVRQLADGRVVSTIKVQGDRGIIAELNYGNSDALEGSTGPLKNSETLDFCPSEKEVIFIHLDHQGSSILATDIEGERIAAVTFLPFGQIDRQRSFGRVSFNLSYAGMRYDPLLDLYFSKARAYCAYSARYLSPDPVQALSDPYAYPYDPINFYDEDGLCPRPSYWQSFSDNYGRPINLKGGVLLTAINCFMVFLPVYSLMFGYDFPESLRWTLGLGAWFLTASFLGNICVHINRAYHGQPNNSDTYLCGSNDLIFFKSLISVIIAVSYLGPMLSFIGNEECEPYALFNCSSDFYMMNIVRGALATSLATPLGNIVGNRIADTAFRNRTLANQYISSVAGLWFSYGIWQFFDILQLKIIYQRNPGDVLYFKRAFLTGEIFLGALMGQPNPVWSLLPAVLPGSYWDYFFAARPETTDGRQIPWFSAPVPQADPQGPQIEILEDPVDITGSPPQIQSIRIDRSEDDEE